VANENGQQWAEDLVRRVGLAIKAARRGNSAAWLSDRTAQLGYRVSPTVIAKLDSGHRGSVLGVAELLVLAAALEVPPVALLFPDLPDGGVAFLPNRMIASDDAMRWFCGESGTMPFDVLSGAVLEASSAPNDKAQLVEAVRERRVLLKQALVAETDERFRQEVVGLLNDVRALNGKIRALGGVVKEHRWAVSSRTSSEGGDD
jgi:hypothetical protein